MTQDNNQRCFSLDQALFQEKRLSRCSEIVARQLSAGGSFVSPTAQRASTAGMVQSTLLQSAALNCAMKKKQRSIEIIPWKGLTDVFGIFDKEVLTALDPEDLNDLNILINAKLCRHSD